MINIDSRILDALNECEMFLVMQIAKRMKQTRMTAWPSLPTLAKDCRWDERTVKKWRDSLIEKGFISIKCDPGKSPVYSFLKDGIGVFTPLKDDQEHQEESDIKEGTKNEGGAIYEGAKNAEEGVHKLYPEVVSKREVVSNENINSEILKITIHDTPKVEFLPLEENSEIKSVEGYNHARAASGLQVEPKPETQQSKPKRKSKNASEPFTYRDMAKYMEIPVQVFFSEIIRNEAWPKWIEYKKNKKKFEYDAADSAAAVVRKLHSISGGDPSKAAEIILQSRSSGWAGLFPLESQQQQRQPYQNQQQPRQRSEVDGLVFSR